MFLTDRPDLTEARMRAALRVGSSPSTTSNAPRGRHRFVQDGEVRVEVVNPRQHRVGDEEHAALAELRHKLQQEQQAHHAAERALRAALDANRQLQTHLTHTEMAAREAAHATAPASELQVEREARQTAEKALQESLDTNRQLQARLAHAEPAVREPAPTTTRQPAKPRAAAAKPQRHGRPAKDEPVEWWKPGWKKRFLAGGS